MEVWGDNPHGCGDKWTRDRWNSGQDIRADEGTNGAILDV